MPDFLDIQFVAAAIGYSNFGTTATAVIPASAQVGDVVVVFGGLSEATIGDPSLSGGGGTGSWVAATPTPIDDNTCRTRAWTRRVVTGDPGATITMTWSATGKGGLVMGVYRNADVLAPINALATALEAGTDTTHDAPGVTPTFENCWIVEHVAQRSGVFTTFTAPAGRTERAEQLGAGAGTIAQILADSGGPVTVNVASGAATYTTDLASANAVGWSIALMPAPAPTTGPIQALSGAGNVTTATITGSSLTIAKPANLRGGMTMVAVINHQNAAGTWGTVPAGWQEVAVFNSVRTSGIWVKPVVSPNAESAADYTWATSGTGSGRMLGTIFLVRQADLDDVFDAIGSWATSGTSSIIAPSVTSGTAGALLLAVYFGYISSATPVALTAPGTMSEVVEWSIASTSSSTGMVAAEVLGAAGATGTRTAGMSPSGSAALGVLLTLNPAEVPTTTPFRGWGVHL